MIKDVLTKMPQKIRGCFLHEYMQHSRVDEVWKFSHRVSNLESKTLFLSIFIYFRWKKMSCGAKIDNLLYVVFMRWYNFYAKTLLDYFEKPRSPRIWHSIFQLDSTRIFMTYLFDIDDPNQDKSINKLL